ncbi:MAG: class I SAM-dependent methyltransferase [Acidobacteriota bacterium]
MDDTFKPPAYAVYQELADAYAAKIETKPHNAFYERPATLSLIGDVDGLRVLDAGCGPGVYAQILAARGAQVDACDLSDRMLELAAERLVNEVAAGSVRLHGLDLTRPLAPFTAEQFHLVLAPLCLDYVADWRSTFAEFHRVLRPAGRLVFSCGHPDFEAEYFDTRDYFSVEPVECTWRGFGEEITMPSYRRSLQEVVMSVLDAGFQLEQLLEPKPTADFLDADPVRYARLMHRPSFLCVAAQKAPPVH